MQDGTNCSVDISGLPTDESWSLRYSPVKGYDVGFRKIDIRQPLRSPTARQAQDAIDQFVELAKQPRLGTCPELALRPSDTTWPMPAYGVQVAILLTISFVVCAWLAWELKHLCGPL